MDEFIRSEKQIRRKQAVRIMICMALLILLSAVLYGCSKTEETGPAAAARTEARRQADGYGVSEDKKLIVYTSHKEEVYGPIIREFEERTGIWVEVRDGGSTELLEAIGREAGQQTCDIMFGGGVESYEAYREYFEPYRCKLSDKLDDRYLSPDDSWTAFTELPIVFIYNNKLVSAEAAPHSWKDFLDDKWRGKIAFAAPGKSGTSYTALATMIQVLDMDERKLMEDFVSALDGKVSAGSGEVVDEVSTGIHLVGITLEETAKKRIAKGADITMIYPEEGTSTVPDGCALVKGAPHEDNAKLFIDFTVSDDVQNLIMDQFCRRTVRKDLQMKTAGEDMKIMDFDLEWASAHQDEILALWSELIR